MPAKISIRIVLKSLIASYIVTGFLLLFAALLLYKLEPKQTMVSVGILMIYVLCSFLGGLFSGKGVGNRKFFWGLVTGALYFLLLFAASWLFNGQIRSDIGRIVTTMVLCLGGGMLGGMLA